MRYIFTDIHVAPKKPSSGSATVWRYSAGDWRGHVRLWFTDYKVGGGQWVAQGGRNGSTHNFGDTVAENKTPLT